MPALDIGDAAPYSVTTGNAHLSYGRIRARRLGRLRACVQHGYFGSRRPTIAAIIAIPMRKSCISIAGAIDRVPYARVHYRWVVERTFAWQYGPGGDGGWQAKLREILAEFDDDCRDLSSSCNCLGEDLAVVSPVKHCRHSGFLVSRAKCHNRSRQRGHSSQAEGFPKTIHNDPLACIIDGPDIIYQEKYRKFLKKGVLCRLRGSGNSNREARSEVS